MFNMFSVKKKDPETPAEIKLEEIKSLLFPPLELRESMKDGDIIKYHIDYSIDTNLDSAITDVQEGYNDKSVIETLADVLNRLYKVRELLEAYMEIDKEAQYIIVDNKKENYDIEAEDIDI